MNDPLIYRFDTVIHVYANTLSIIELDCFLITEWRIVEDRGDIL